MRFIATRSCDTAALRKKAPADGAGSTAMGELYRDGNSRTLVRVGELTAAMAASIRMEARGERDPSKRVHIFASVNLNPTCFEYFRTGADFCSSVDSERVQQIWNSAEGLAAC